MYKTNITVKPTTKNRPIKIWENDTKVDKNTVLIMIVLGKIYTYPNIYILRMKGSNK